MANRTTDVTLKELVTRIAKAKGIDEAKMGKQVRSRIRSNLDNGTIVPSKHWPSYAKAGKENRDGNRYPTMPPALADALFTSMTKGKALKELIETPKKSRARAPKVDEVPAEVTTEA